MAQLLPRPVLVTFGADHPNIRHQLHDVLTEESIFVTDGLVLKDRTAILGVRPRGSVCIWRMLTMAILCAIEAGNEHRSCHCQVLSLAAGSILAQSEL